MRILIVEDEIKIAKVIAATLKRESYAVDIAYDGEEGYAMASSEPYAAIILDRMLPGLNGIDIITKLRKEGIKIPILMLTAMGTIEDRTSGLDSGADDYLIKPFSLEELTARIRALLRRPQISKDDTLTVADLILNHSHKTVYRDTKPISLTAKEFALLDYLMRHHDQVLSKDHLIANVWDFDADILPNTVEAHIKQLRQKVDKPFKKPLIKTVRGFGYKITS